MRFYFHVITVLVTILWVGKADGGSDLEKVYDDLATVTRITNAIALQAAAIRKSVKIRDVVVELLKVDAKNFTELINYKPEILTAATKSLFAETKKIRNFDSKPLNGVRPALETLRDAMKNTTAVIDDTYEKLKPFLNYLTVGDFLSKLGPCDKSVTDLIVKVSKLVKGDTVPEPETVFNDFKRFHSEIDSCLNSPKIFELDDGTPYISGINWFRYLQPLVSKTKSHFGVIQKVSKTAVEALQNGFEMTDGLWTLQKTQKSGDLFHDSVHKLAGMFGLPPRIDKTYTIGFSEPGDMSKVDKDLDSELFKTKIARGKSVEGLKEEMQGFFKFGNMMTDLESDWQNFGDGFKQLKKAAFKVSGIMRKMDSFQEASQGSALLNNALSVINTCSPKMPSEPKGIEDLMQQIDALANYFTDISYATDQLKKQNLTIARDEISQLNSYNSWADAKKSVTDYPTMINLVASFDTIAQSQGKINSMIPNIRDIFKNNQTRGAIESLKGLHFYLHCLKIGNFDPQGLIEIYVAVYNVRQLSDESIEFGIEKVLNEYISIRKHVLKLEKFVKDIGPNYMKKTHDDNPVLKLEHSQELVLSLGRGIHVLRDMSRAWNMKDLLKSTTNFTKDVNDKVSFLKHPSIKKFWPKRKEKVDKLITELRGLDAFAATVKNDGLLTMRTVLDEATKIQGFPEVFRHILKSIANRKNTKVFRETLTTLSDLDLDFASHRGNLQAASLSFDELRIYFDEIFGLNQSESEEVEHNYLAAILISIAIFLVLVVGIFLICGLTKSGRKMLRTWYFYYFAKDEDYEKRWRYALFMDKQEGKNALLDAAREINATNVLKAVKKGAYINAFNQFGNTALHVATKRGYPEIVEILIKNGADRSYLNARNKTAEQLIPENWRTSQTAQTEVTERFDEVEKVYKKYRNKKFRKRFPEKFPSSSFHIYVDERADEVVTADFMKKFQAITSNEPLPTTTHYIVRTDQDGVLELDSLELLVWVLSGVIIVKDSWMADCLKDPKLIEKDSQYLVKNVKYRGVLYDTVIHWSESMAKFSMPYLCGVYVGVTIPEYQNLIPLTSIVVTHGGVMCSKFPEKSMFNIGSHPYLHAHLGPIFIIHDGKSDIELYRNDPDKMYTMFTEEEFVAFLLKRGINVDVRPEPIPPTTEPDD